MTQKSLEEAARDALQRKLRFGKFGLLDDPVGGHCVVLGKILEVIGVHRDYITGNTMLNVRHLCGDTHHPVLAAAVTMLVRTYE